MTTEKPVLAPGLLASNGVAHEPLEEPHLTDSGNAIRYAKDHRGRVLYCPSRGWLVWDQQRFALDRTGLTMYLTGQTVAGIYAEAGYVSDPKERRRLAEHALKSEAEPRRRAMLNLAASEPGIPVLESQLDTNRYYLNLANCTYDLREFKAHPHRPEDLLSKVAPVNYDPDAQCPRFMTFMGRIFAARTTLIEFMQRVIGYCLTGDVSERCFFVLWGTGANGKTTLLKVVSWLLGDYAAWTRAETFMPKRMETIPSDVAALASARFVIAAESERGQRLAEALVKQVTGDDRITARFLHRDFFTFDPVFKLVIASNYKPVIRGTGQAIWSRVKLVPFTVTIPPEEQDRHLAEALRDELPGILNWAIAGCREWQKGGLRTPPEVEDATQTYFAEMDVLGDFLREKCFAEKAASITVATLYEKYCEWAHLNNEKPISKKALGMLLQERGFIPKPTRDGRTWRGLRLRGIDDPEPCVDALTHGDAFSKTPLMSARKEENPQNTSTHVNTSTEPDEVLPAWVME